jgi:hypothetical protein
MRKSLRTVTLSCTFFPLRQPQAAAGESAIAGQCGGI